MNQKQIAASLKEISRAVAAATDERDLEIFLRSLLTPKEIEDVSSRWEIFKQLKDGVTQRQISKNLGVSLCKITRGSKEMKTKRDIISDMLKKI